MNEPTTRIVECLHAKKNGKGWIARCPAHDDRHASLTIGEGNDGRALIHCQAGCEAKDVVSALGLKMADLFPPKDNGHAKAHGRIVATYPYRDEHGTFLYEVVRFNPKDFKQRRPDGAGGWLWNLQGVRRIVFNLADVLGADGDTFVYFCEGEKDALNVKACGLIGTTTPQGAGKAHLCDLTPLHKRHVAILNHNDKTGRDHAEQVAQLLHGKAASVRVLDLSKHAELPGKGDVSDWLDLGHDVEELVRLAKTAPLWEPEPASEAAPQWRPFPLDVLPEPIRSFIADAAKAIGCDPSFIALPLLAALASAIGGARCVMLMRGWTEPAILWCVIVGESGTLKTPAFKLAMKAIRDRQRKAMKRYQEAMEVYERELAEYERASTKWKKSTTSEEPPVKPKPPAAERFIVSDTTVEGLAQVLRDNPRGVLLSRDEIAGWIGSFDRYSKGKAGTSVDSSHWLSMHNGETVIVDRKTGQRITYVPMAIVSIVGGIQPEILRRALGVEHQENGLAARLLLTMPPRRPKRWTEADIDPKEEERIAAIVDRLYELQPDIDGEGDPRPKVIPLTADAKRLWVQFFNEHNVEQVELTGNLAAAWSKLEAYAPRLALVLHCVRWAAGDLALTTPDEIDAVSMSAAITVTRWFANEARRMYSLLAEDEEDRDRRQLMDWIERMGGSVTPRDLMRSSRQFKTAGDAENVLADLIEAGYGQWESVAPGGKGGAPSKRFILADKTPRHDPADSADNDKTPRHDSAKDGSVSVGSVSASAGGGCVNPDAASDEWGEI